MGSERKKILICGLWNLVGPLLGQRSIHEQNDPTHSEKSIRVMGCVARDPPSPGLAHSFILPGWWRLSDSDCQRRTRTRIAKDGEEARVSDGGGRRWRREVVETRGNAGGARLWQGPHRRVRREITVGGGGGGTVLN
jgi:hypothetical protein